MRQKLRIFNDWAVRVFRSPRMFYAVVALLTLQAGWIALTARYPQAFDENYHFGLIQLHAQQWLPWFSEQPAGAAVHGAVVRDASYLFHYLLSLPYRVLALVTPHEALQIIMLRLLNIAFFIWGMFVYRNLLRELKTTTAMQNIVLLIFVLLPVVPLLAAQINYDNLMFVLCGLLFLYVSRFIVYLRKRQPTAPLIPADLVLKILITGAVGSVVKFAFAPIFFGAVIAVLVATAFYYYLMRIKPKRLRNLVDTGSSRLKLVLLGLAALVAIGLCIERYGVNLVQYQTAVPKCDQVLTIDACQQYSPWARDYLFNQIYPRPTLQGYLVYPFVWVNRMVFETLFTITSFFNPDGTVTYLAYSPLRIGHVAGWIGFGVGLIGALIFWRRIRRNRSLTVLLGIIIFYTLVLFIQNLGMYIHSGEAVAIHGRYLVPVFPVLLLALAIGWRGLLAHFKQGRYEAVALVALTLLFLQGAGITNWIERSDPSWYWQHSPSALKANQTIKSVSDPLLYDQL